MSQDRATLVRSFNSPEAIAARDKYFSASAELLVSAKAAADRGDATTAFTLLDLFVAGHDSAKSGTKILPEDLLGQIDSNRTNYLVADAVEIAKVLLNQGYEQAGNYIQHFYLREAVNYTDTYLSNVEADRERMAAMQTPQAMANCCE